MTVAGSLTSNVLVPTKNIFTTIWSNFEKFRYTFSFNLFGNVNETIFKVNTRITADETNHKTCCAFVAILSILLMIDDLSERF